MNKLFSLEIQDIFCYLRYNQIGIFHEKFKKEE